MLSEDEIPTVSGDVGVVLWLNEPLGTSVLPLNVVSNESGIASIPDFGLGDSNQEFDAAHAVPTAVFKSRLRAAFSLARTQLRPPIRFTSELFYKSLSQKIIPIGAIFRTVPIKITKNHFSPTISTS